MRSIRASPVDYVTLRTDKLKHVWLDVCIKQYYHTVTLDGYWKQHGAHYEVQQQDE